MHNVGFQEKFTLTIMGKRISSETTRKLLLGGGAVIVVLVVALIVMVSGSDDAAGGEAMPVATPPPPVQKILDGYNPSPAPPCLDQPSCEEFTSQLGCSHDLHLSDPAIPIGVVRELSA